MTINPQVVAACKQFLLRVNLQGNEVPAFVAVFNMLDELEKSTQIPHEQPALSDSKPEVNS